MICIPEAGLAADALEASADEAETLCDDRFVTQLHMPGLNDPWAVRGPCATGSRSRRTSIGAGYATRVPVSHEPPRAL